MALQPIPLDPDTFALKVLEERLKVVGPYQGYYYAGMDDRKAYRTPAVLRRFWSYRQVCTQDNVAGGTLRFRLTPEAETAVIPLYGLLTASGNRAVQMTVENADDATIGYMSVVGAAAGATATIAGLPVTATSSNATQFLQWKPVANPNYIEGSVASAAQTETATLTFYMELVNTATAPGVSWAASDGTPNAAAATEDTVSEVEGWQS